MTNNINNFDSGLDDQHEGLDIKLNHIIMMLDELLKHVPIDKNTREQASFCIYEQKKSYGRALGYGIQIFC